MNNLQFPLDLVFRIGTLSNDFVATDANGRQVAYVRQKLFKFIEEIQVFKDDTKSELSYTIKANQWIDFSATYVFTNSSNTELGRVARKGWRSMWRAHYDIFDQHQQQDLTISEENPWAKVMDGFLGEIPLVGMFTGYLFHPSYLLTRPGGKPVARLKKEPSFIGRRFKVEKLDEFEEGEEERVLLGLMMMILLERQRG